MDIDIFFLLCYATLGIYLCFESFLILMILTRSKKPPNARQNTKGPARSVSSMILESVCCSGLRTDNVCKKCINNHKNKLFVNQLELPVKHNKTTDYTVPRILLPLAKCAQSLFQVL